MNTKRFIIVVVLSILIILLFTSQNQNKEDIRSPVDLRDPNEAKPSLIIIIECDCICDTIPTPIIKDSIPIS